MWITKKPDSIYHDIMILSLRPHLISLLIPHAVGEDKHNNGHLAEPYEDPEPCYLNPHESWRLQLKGAHCICRESQFLSDQDDCLQLSEKGKKIQMQSVIKFRSLDFLIIRSSYLECLNVHLNAQ